MRTLIKRFRNAVAENDAPAAAKSFADAERAIRKATTKGIVPQSRANRHISRLARSLNAMSGS